MEKNSNSANEVLNQVCRLPIDFRQLNKFSPIELVKRSGYLEAKGVVTREAVEGWLRKNPGVVEAWLTWSDDKRTPEGWVFQESAGQRYVVYYYPGGEKLIFTDQFKACAEFVVREIESIARHI